MFAELARTAQARYGFTIQPHRFAVTGLCARCRQLLDSAHQGS
jgi:Fe2+ or Zn2+ uptake regulation protein